MRLDADPRPWPRYEEADLQAMALLIIDMQADFCSLGGYMDQMGCDLAPLQAPITAIRQVLDAFHAAGLAVVFTRQGYRGDLSDMPPSRRRSIARGESVVGNVGPLGRCLIRNEPGWRIIDEISPVEGDMIVDKTANSAFYGTDLEPLLRANGIRHLVLCGNTLDVCVHSTLRSADDRGYDCLVVSDGCGCVNPGVGKAALDMIRAENGVLGCIATSRQIAAAVVSEGQERG